jgi:hypothetical protein
MMGNIFWGVVQSYQATPPNTMTKPQSENLDSPVKCIGGNVQVTNKNQIKYLVPTK